MELHTIGIDLGKTAFHVVGLDATGRAVIGKKCSRRESSRRCSTESDCATLEYIFGGLLSFTL